MLCREWHVGVICVWPCRTGRVAHWQTRVSAHKMYVIRLTKAPKLSMLLYCRKFASDQQELFWYPAVIRAL